jgi:hypothetical protein
MMQGQKEMPVLNKGSKHTGKSKVKRVKLFP